MPRGDIDSVKIGQKATARLIALNQRTTPILNGTVEYVSADAVASDTGQQARREAYVVRVSLTRQSWRASRISRPSPGCRSRS
ncbi:MAG: HlyD family secretion protein [Rhodobacteraceae bacterium]|nr:HlyD family secretion protein [Paracoccaceae bacterium]